jgi:hypothetical protein
MKLSPPVETVVLWMALPLGCFFPQEMLLYYERRKMPVLWPDWQALKGLLKERRPNWD